jgi:hypothetical protein
MLEVSFLVGPRNGYGANCVTAVFPGLMESIEAEDWTNGKRWVDIIEGCILTAARKAAV